MQRTGCRVVAVVNQKGGAGKTTTAVNLAAALAEAGAPVLLVDLDPQASATRWLAGDGAGLTVLEAFTGSNSNHLAAATFAASAPGVDLVPASPLLAGVERSTAAHAAPQFLLRRALEKLPEGRWRWILLDCPPALGMLTINALTAADAVLVPVEARIMALAGLAALMDTLDVIRADLNPGLELAGIVACRVDARTRLSLDVVTYLRETYGADVLAATIRETVRLAEAPQYQQPITLTEPAGPASADFRALAAELTARS
jgi:chromosome partitioning protein